MFLRVQSFPGKRLSALVLVILVAAFACACGASTATPEETAVITPAPILQDLPMTADETAVDYATYILGEWVSTEPVVDGTWYLYAKYMDNGIAGLRAVKPKGNVADYSKFNEDNWVFGEMTPGTYEVIDDLITNDFNGQKGAYVITWDYFDQMTLEGGATYYRVA